MDTQDKKKSHPPGHENHNVHVCHKCGWSFPNPHPSAKHRRAHKKVCGKIEGFRLTVSGEKAHSDSDLSDDDQKPQQSPLPASHVESVVERVDEKKASGTGIVAQGSGRSDEEVFSDAVAEFGDAESTRVVEVVGHASESSAVADNTPRLAEVTCSDLSQDVDALRSSLDDSTPTTLNSSAYATGESILDERADLAVKLADCGGPAYSSISASQLHSETPIDDPIDNTNADNGGLNFCVKDKEKSIKDEMLPAMEMLPNITAGSSAVVEVPTELADSTTFATMDIPSEGMIMEIKEPDSIICHVDEEKTSGSEQQNLERELGFVEPEVDGVHSAENAEASEVSTPIITVAGALQVDGSGSSIHEESFVYQSILSGKEGSESIAHASTECMAEGIVLADSVAYPDSADEKSEVTKAINPDNVVIDSSQIDTTIIHLEKNEPDFYLKESESGHALPHEVLPETSSGLASGHKESSCDLSHEVMLETPAAFMGRSDIAGSIVETDVDEAMPMCSGKEASPEFADEGIDFNESTANTDSINAKPIVTEAVNPDATVTGSTETNPRVIHSEEKELYCSIGEERSIYDEVIMKAPSILAAGGKESDHDFPAEVVLETPEVVVAGGDVAESSVKTEVYQAIAMDSGRDASNECVAEGIGLDRLAIDPDSTSAKPVVTETIDSDGGVMVSSEMDGTIIHSVENVPDSSFGKKESGDDLPHQVSLEASTNLAAGSKESAHHLPHAIVAESPIVLATGGDTGATAVETEFHQPISVESGGDAVVHEGTRTEVFDIVRDYSKGAVDESSLPVTKTVPELATDNLKIISQFEDLGTDKLEGNLQLAEPTHGNTIVGSEGMEIKNDPLENVSEDYCADSSVIEKEVQVEAIRTGNELAKDPHEEPKLDLISDVGVDQFGVQNAAPEESVSVAVEMESFVHSLAILNNKTEDIATGNASEIHDHSLPVEGTKIVLKQNANASVMVTDASIDSVSQDDSLEGNWGSVSDIPTPKEAPDASLKKGSAYDDNRVDNTYVFEAPSFMTLVEPSKGEKRPPASEIQSIQQPSSPSQPGWFPSLTHVANESQGRKKNEEIIAKVVNWSTGKPHTPLKSLLVEANLETKHKPSQMVQDRVSPTAQEDQALLERRPPAKTASLKLPSGTAAKSDAEKEWNSPARLPVIKRERRKVRGWVPFVCCSSVN